MQYTKLDTASDTAFEPNIYVKPLTSVTIRDSENDLCLVSRVLLANASEAYTSKSYSNTSFLNLRDLNCLLEIKLPLSPIQR